MEVTEYHSSQKRRQVEEAWTDIILASRPLREQYPEVNSLFVHLELKKQRLPKKAQIGSFIDEVIKLCRDHTDRVGNEDLYLHPDPGSYPMLACFAKYVILREVGTCMSWHSSLDSANVGLTEEELLKAVEKKANSAQRPEGVDGFWLMVAGGFRISQVFGFLSEEDLQEFAKVNSVLKASAFDAVYLCNSQTARWTPDAGWKMVREWGDQGN